MVSFVTVFCRLQIFVNLFEYLAYRRVCAAGGVTSVEDVQTEMDTCGKSITIWLDGLSAANNARANPLALETAANRVMGL